MQTSSLFKALLIANLIFGALGIFVDSAFIDNLPPILHGYIAGVAEEASDAKIAMMLFYFLAFILLSLINYFGLWRFKPWARTLYVVVMAASIPSTIVTGPIVMSGWAAMFCFIAIVIQGVLLGLMFTGEVGARFRRPDSEVC